MSKNNLLMTITNDFLKDVNSATLEVLEQTPTKIHSKVTYPNGFVMETIIENGDVTMITSHKIVHLEGNDWEVDMEQPW